MMTALAIPRPSIEDRIRAAFWFAERGFGVFSVWSTDDNGTCRCPLGPDCEQPGKHPVPRIGFKAATTDHARIRAMLTIPSAPNWGMLPPDGVFVLDVDGDGVDRLAGLEALHGPLPATLRTNTAHGQHVFLRWPESLPRPIGQLFGYVTRWGSGANAGYVIGPRSVHPTGAVYAPVPGSLEVSDLPDTWAQAAIAPTTTPASDSIEFSSGYDLPEDGYAGARYDAIVRYTASRYMRGLSKEEIWAGVLTVLAPLFAEPLTESELRSRFERAWKDTPERLGPPAGAPEELVVPQAVHAATALLTAPTWPEPPDDAAFHGPAGDVVRVVAEATEADPVGILGSLLASIGASMGHYRYLYQGGAQSTNLFVVLVGDSSSGRKGTAGSIARAVMTAAYPAWNDLIVPGLGSGEGLVSHLSPKDGKSAEHRALVMESEFSRLLTSMMRDGSTLSPMLRDAWDGVPMGRVLARESRIVKFHHVGVLAHITPIELRARLTTTDAANGFGNRFIWLAVKRTRLLPFPTDPRELVPVHLLGRIHDAILDAQTPGEVRWSPAAREAWEAFYLEVALRAATGLFGSMVARAEAQVGRLALLYALLDRSEDIEVEHLAAARALWQYAERSVEHVFGRSTGDAVADSLLGYLADGPLSWEDAKRALGIRVVTVLDAAVEQLARLGLVEVVKVARSGGGRAARWIRKPDQTMQNVQTTQAPAQGEDA